MATAVGRNRLKIVHQMAHWREGMYCESVSKAVFLQEEKNDDLAHVTREVVEYV